MSNANYFTCTHTHSHSTHFFGSLKLIVVKLFLLRRASIIPNDDLLFHFILFCFSIQFNSNNWFLNCLKTVFCHQRYYYLCKHRKCLMKMMVTNFSLKCQRIILWQHFQRNGFGIFFCFIHTSDSNAAKTTMIQANSISWPSFRSMFSAASIFGPILIAFFRCYWRLLYQTWLIYLMLASYYRNPLFSMSICDTALNREKE